MRGRTGVGILILMVGAFYLLQQIGVFIVPSLWLSGQVVWPLILFVVGIFGLGGFQKGRIHWGSLFFTVLGLAYLVKRIAVLPWLNKIGYMPFFFALLIIFFGLQLIVPNKKSGFFWSPFTVGYRYKRNEKDSEDFF